MHPLLTRHCHDGYRNTCELHPLQHPLQHSQLGIQLPHRYPSYTNRYISYHRPLTATSQLRPAAPATSTTITHNYKIEMSVLRFTWLHTEWSKVSGSPPACMSRTHEGPLRPCSHKIAMISCVESDSRVVRGCCGCQCSWSGLGVASSVATHPAVGV